MVMDAKHGVERVWKRGQLASIINAPYQACSEALHSPPDLTRPLCDAHCALATAVAYIAYESGLDLRLGALPTYLLI